LLFDSLDPSWKKEFNPNLFEKLRELNNFVIREYETKEIFPKQENIFNAFSLTPFNKVKVVILGQDPYHGEDQAHGLSFSVNDGIKLPPSLRNIFKEYENDLRLKAPISGDLSSWAKNGVLLLNTVLTVEKGKAGSHQKKGWESFTLETINVINQKKENIVFILWGSPAQKMEKYINPDKHHVIKSVHPSPLSSYRGFFDSKPFSKANEYFKQNKLEQLNWKL